MPTRLPSSQKGTIPLFCNIRTKRDSPHLFHMSASFTFQASKSDVYSNLDS